MPKIIVTSRYMRNTPKLTATNLVKYMGTREGVEDAYDWQKGE